MKSLPLGGEEKPADPKSGNYPEGQAANPMLKELLDSKMAEINWHEVEIHHFNFGHGRGLIRIVHVPTGYFCRSRQLEGIYNRCREAKARTGKESIRRELYHSVEMIMGAGSGTHGFASQSRIRSFRLRSSEWCSHHPLLIAFPSESKETYTTPSPGKVHHTGPTGAIFPRAP